MSFSGKWSLHANTMVFEESSNNTYTAWWGGIGGLWNKPSFPSALKLFWESIVTRLFFGICAREDVSSMLRLWARKWFESLANFFPPSSESQVELKRANPHTSFMGLWCMGWIGWFSGNKVAPNFWWKNQPRVSRWLLGFYNANCPKDGKRKLEPTAERKDERTSEQAPDCLTFKNLKLPTRTNLIDFHFKGWWLLVKVEGRNRRRCHV